MVVGLSGVTDAAPTPRNRGGRKTANQRRRESASNGGKKLSAYQRAEGPEKAGLAAGEALTFEQYAPSRLKIQTKSREFIPFKLNVPQLLLEWLAQDLEAAGLPVWLWIPKARQLGISTWVQGRIAYRSFTSRDMTGTVVAHKDGPANEIFTKLKLMYDHLPEEERPTTKYNNRKELDLRHPTGDLGLRSRIMVMVSADPDASRGVTASNLHVSEIASYSRPEEFMLGTLQSVPDDGMIVVESTCVGAGDYHHEQYLGARVHWRDSDGNVWVPPWMPLKEKHPGLEDNPFVAVFLPWFIHDEYRRPVEDPEAFERSLDQEERELLAKFAPWVTLESLKWRRVMIAGKCGGQVIRFKQEYPSTDEEAFAHSGAPAFDHDSIARQESFHVCHCDLCLPYIGAPVPPGNTSPPHRWYEIRDASASTALGIRQRPWRQMYPQLAEATPGVGRLSVWQDPKPGRRYVVFADVGKGDVGSDLSDAAVVRVDTLEQVATWRGKPRMDEYGQILVLLAMHYNNALLAIEDTGIGAGCVIIVENFRYPRIYRRSSLAVLDGNTSRGSSFSTNASTKPGMVGLMDQALKHDDVVIRDRVTIDQMRAYRAEIVRTKDGAEGAYCRYSAPRGKHDDACMAMMGGFYVAMEQPGAGRPILDMKTGPQVSSANFTMEDWDRLHRQQDLRRAAMLGLI